MKDKVSLSRLMQAVRNAAEHMRIGEAQQAMKQLENDTRPAARLLRAAAAERVAEHDAEMDAIADDIEAIADMESWE